MSERYAAEPFSEPDGSTSWAVRRYVRQADYYARHIVSWHRTHAQAREALARLRGERRTG